MVHSPRVLFYPRGSRILIHSGSFFSIFLSLRLYISPDLPASLCPALDVYTFFNSS